MTPTELAAFKAMIAHSRTQTLGLLLAGLSVIAAMLLKIGGWF